MSLPILQGGREAGRDDLIRLFHRTELHWARHLGEETPLELGTAIHNAELANVWDANVVLDAALPEGMTPADALAEANDHFTSNGSRLWKIITNPSAAAEHTAPLVNHLLGAGWIAQPADVLYLTRKFVPAVTADGVSIIPARAGFRLAHALASEAAAVHGEPQVADAAMLHLDDPHWDALLALQDGIGIGSAGVLAVGEVGRIDQVYVRLSHRGQGVAMALMARVLEICFRSQFRHVMLSVRPDNEAAQSLYRRLGFQRIGDITEYRAPEAS